MKVNPSKTQLLCTTTAINYDIRAYIYTEEGPLISGDTLTTVGYTLGRRSGAGEHIKKVRQKYGSRAGILRHLKKIGIYKPVLTKIYTSHLRPLFEYGIPCFGQSLTD